MEKLQTTATVLIVPGLRDHVAEHWQTLLAGRLAKVRRLAIRVSEGRRLGMAIR